MSAAILSHRRSGGWIWIAAFGATLSMHVGAAGLGLVDFSAPKPADDAGYIAVDLVAPPAAPKVDAPDLPVGAESPEIAPSVAATAAPSAPVPDETPPVPQADAADAIQQAPPVPPPPPETPPDEAKPDPKQKLEIQSEAAAASEAKAPPKIEAPADDHPAAPAVIGTMEADEKARVTWIKLLGAHLDRHKRFPAGQRAERRSIEVRIQFQLASDGRVVTARITGSSGNAAFDQAALTTLTRASPVPTPPASVLAAGATFTIPIVFRAKD